MFLRPKIHKISKTAIVPYSTNDMFNLVNDIKNYPKFLNWCINSDILQQTTTEITASITVNKGVMTETFTTINTLEHNKITMRLKDGVFKKLHGVWTFTELGKLASKISLDMEFSFNNKLLDISMSPIFSKIASSQLDAFTIRAKNIYT